MAQYRRVAQLRTAEKLTEYLNELGIDLPFDETVQSGLDSPLAQSKTVKGFTIGNRFAILPMEGWDGTADGHPSDLTFRRWERFGLSGAKLIWGGEAVAVRHDGRANPNQLMINAETLPDIIALRERLVKAHEDHYGSSDDLMVGLQLTHSGRFARPNVKTRLESLVLYHHPILEARYGFNEYSKVMTDDDIAQLIQDFVMAAKRAKEAGYDFVDVKHCHGYLGHEFLSAVDRPGPYGGSFENRTRFLREIVDGIRAEAPGLEIGVRLSAFDWVPFQPGEDNTGEPEAVEDYRYAFGGDSSGTAIDYAEPFKFLDLLYELGVELVCLSAGSPYYNPHIQRPALFPPSDGYDPPEDPLLGVARQIAAVERLKQHRPELTIVGSGYSYLQEWLPNVAQHVVRAEMADFVGLGRMVLSYPDLPHDILAGNPMQRKQFCRTFSDCTTAPRHGMVSGCYPLDEFYKEREENEALAQIKQENA
jgi:NADPH2 dehydrogenase